MNGAELLRQHGEFVRALARSLVHDPNQADDVAQETWLRWFTHPPRDRSRPRGWLAVVARSVASNERRSAQRREDRDRLAPGGAPAPSPLDETLQAELVTRTVAAVMALEVGQRDVILAGYFRGVSLAELARSSGTNEDTLRARERRALEELRNQLDRVFGARSAWAVGLGEFARRETFAPVPQGASAASAAHATLWLVAGVLAVGGTLGLVLWRARGTESATGPAPAVVAELASPAMVEAAVEPHTEPVRTALEPVQGRIEVPHQAAGSDTDSSSNQAVTSGLAELHGTFRYEDGSPAAGVAWTVSGWEANEERRIRFGEPEDWSDPSGTTDAQGELVASFFPPGAYQFTLDVKTAGHAGASWRWSEIAAGARVELGTITLPRGATVTGRLVDSSGAPILGETWHLYIDSIGLGEDEGRDETRVMGELDPTTGTFLLADVHRGRNVLKAYNRMASWIEGQELTVAAGETITRDLVYTGPRNANRITVSTSCRPLYVRSNPAEGSIHLLLPDGSRRTALKVAGSSQSYSFDDLPPGDYVVEIDDPDYLPFRSEPVQPGAGVSAKLVPASAIVLDVRGADGSPVQPEQVTLEFLNVNFRPNELLVHEGSAPFDGTVRLFAGDYVVHVAAGEERGSLAVSGIVRGETRPVTLSLEAQARLAGSLRRADGTRLAGIEVHLLAPAREADSDASPILGPNSFTSNEARHRKQLAATTTDDQGGFEFPVPMAGNYLVHAEVGSGLRVFSPVIALGSGEVRDDLELVAPRGATLTGRVLGPGGPLAGLRLWVGQASDQPQDLAPLAQPIGSDGTFRIEGLPSGTVLARLLLPESSAWQWAWEELGSLELQDGVTHRHDFNLAYALGALALEVRVNGAAMPGVRVTLQRKLASMVQRLERSAGPEGSFEPIPLFPGTWTVHLADPGRAWNASGPSVLVPSASTAASAIDLTIAEGTLRFLDASGQPLARTRIRVQLDQPDVETSQSKETDADGRANFRLATGDYLFSLESGTPTRITWTSTGPLESDVRL